MLRSVFDKISGRGQWPEAEATVTSSAEVSDGGYKSGWPIVRVVFQYRDSIGNLQYGEMLAGSMTSAYNLVEGDNFTIRYNPKAPEKFYCPEASSFEIDWNLWLIGGAAGLVVIALEALAKHK